MVPGVREQQDHRADSPIALLEADPTLEGLNVADMRLGLDPGGPAQPVDGGVPRSQVDRPRCRQLDHRHFCAPSQSGANLSSEAPEHGDLGSIADGRANWKTASRELEADDGIELGQALNRHFRRLATADPGDLTLGHQERSADVGIAQAVLEAGLLRGAPKVGDQQATACGPLAPLGFASWHSPRMAAAAWSPLIQGGWIRL
jgi:hypothetical protein